jgi:hypothetical protein
VINDFILKPFITDENQFYVSVDDTVVASIIRTENDTWFAAADKAKTEYDSALLAAFADANLSDPAYWSND